MALIKFINISADINNTWEFIGFAFIAGTFILSIRPEYTKKEQIKILPQISFSMILSAILLILGLGISYGEGPGTMNGFIVHILSECIIFFSIFLFSFALSELLILLSKNVFPKK